MKRHPSKERRGGLYGLRYGPYQETTAPKDSLDTSRIPTDADAPIEWNESPHPLKEDISDFVYTAVFQLTVIWAVNSFLALPLCRRYGLTLSSPSAVSVWAALSVIAGFYAALKRWDWEFVAAAFLSPLVAPLLITVIVLGESGWIIGFAGAGLMTALLVDMTANDFFFWLTASSFVRAAAEKRSVWAGRFFGRLRLIDYPIGFVLFVVAVDLHLRAPKRIEQLWVILIVFGALAIIWNARRAPIAVYDALLLSAHAVLLWFTWGRSEDDIWEPRLPGMFHSRFGPVLVRRIFAFVVLLVLSGVFHRSVRTWSNGEHAMWGLIINALLVWAFPLALFFFLLFAVAGRTLATTARAVAEASDENLWSAIVERLNER